MRWRASAVANNSCCWAISRSSIAASELASLAYSASLARRTAATACGPRPLTTRQYRLRRRADRQGHVLACRHEGSAIRPEDAQVRPGAEGPARARDDDDAHGFAPGEHPQRFMQVPALRPVERIELLGPVQRHRPDPARDLHQDAVVAGHQHRSTISAIPWPTPMHIVAKP